MVSPTTNSGTSGDRGPGRPQAAGAAQQAAAAQPQRGWLLVVFIAIYVVVLGLAARLLLAAADSGYLAWYVVLLIVFFVLYTLVWARPRMSPPFLHAIFVVQCAVVIVLLLLDRDFDYVTAFFAVLSYQAAVVFGGRTRWLWVGTLVLLIAVSLSVAWGLLHGLGFAFTTMAFAIVLPGLAVATQEIEASRARSRAIVDELGATNLRLKKYTAEVEDLAVLEERNRLARELHDSVSQAMFGIQLATRAAQILRKKDPDAVPAQLEQLQTLTHEALARMRGFISELRPKS
jgi:signal transduction histidine kinase